METLRLPPSARERAAQVLARAFFDYPVMAAHWPDRRRREKYLAWYLGCTVEYGLRYGEVYTTPDVAGVAIWLPPGRTRFTTWRYIRAGFAPAPLRMGLRRSFGQARRFEDWTQKVHAEAAPGPHWYLWSLAVDPLQQGRGLGSLLMQPGLRAADAQRLPCYLETHDERNLPFYRRHGFDLARAGTVPGSDLRFWGFLRPAGAGAA